MRGVEADDPETQRLRAAEGQEGYKKKEEDGAKHGWGGV
jgi:hypothetical protein